MTEIIISWGFVFVVLLVVFRMLNRRWHQAPPRKNALVLLRAISVGLALVLNVVLSLLLYEPVMGLFDINTHGFINLNGLATLATIWCIIALISLGMVVNAKALLGVYHKPLRVAYFAFSVLPIAIILLFLLVAGLK